MMRLAKASPLLCETFIPLYHYTILSPLAIPTGGKNRAQIAIKTEQREIYRRYDPLYATLPKRINLRYN